MRIFKTEIILGPVPPSIGRKLHFKKYNVYEECILLKISETVTHSNTFNSLPVFLVDRLIEQLLKNDIIPFFPSKTCAFLLPKVNSVNIW